MITAERTEPDHEPDQVPPASTDCPKCGCCTAALCERGRLSVERCVGLTPPEYQHTVYDCPCSSPLTRGTHAWRAERVRVTWVATEAPLPPINEVLLRSLAVGAEVDEVASRTLLAQLRVSGFAAETDAGHVITELGHLYLATRGVPRHVTPVEVVTIDTKDRTASVVVVGWDVERPVTVLLDQLTTDTGLSAAELPGMVLDAWANCGAASADDVVLTQIEVSPGAGP